MKRKLIVLLNNAYIFCGRNPEAAMKYVASARQLDFLYSRAVDRNLKFLDNVWIAEKDYKKYRITFDIMFDVEELG